ncbi:MAG: polyprenyl diphosphate synthase [Thermoleophilia bacterium]
MGIVGRLRGLYGRRRREESSLPGEIPADRVPDHVGVIMDGNGRWAAKRHLPVAMGHREGTRALKRTVEAAIRAGVRQLTVYSFSTENWARPADEVQGLLSLLDEMIDREIPELDEKGVRVVFVGRRDGVAAELAGKFAQAEEATRANTSLDLFIAFDYGGRREIVDAVRSALAAGVAAADLDEHTLGLHLYAPTMRDPDLVIRTSGELRLSNFLLWESAYSELYFSEALWPDFDETEFRRALADYASRERRFGKREPAPGSLIAPSRPDGEASS